MKSNQQSQHRRRYDSEFKREAVRIAATTGTTDRQVERDLDLYQERSEPGAMNWSWILSTRSRGQDIRSPWRRRAANFDVLDVARQERDILKKAVAIFSKTPRIGSDL